MALSLCSRRLPCQLLHPRTPNPALSLTRPGLSGRALLGKRLLFTSLPLSSLLTAAAKPKCSLPGEAPHPTLQEALALVSGSSCWPPRGLGSGDDSSRPNQSSPALRSPGLPVQHPHSLSTHPPHLLPLVLRPQPASAPPLHTRTDTPLPSPQRGGQPAWYPGSSGSGPSAPEDPHPSHRNKSAEPRRPAGAPGLAAVLPWPRRDPCRLPRSGSPASCTSRTYPSQGEGSPRGKQAQFRGPLRVFCIDSSGLENNGAALCASSARASFVPPFPPARLPLAKGQRLPRQPGVSAPDPRPFHTL